METNQVTTGREARFLNAFTDPETNITVQAGTELPIIDFKPDKVQCLAQDQDGGCPIWVPRTVVKIEK
jgi:hypothetical protein